MTSPRLLPLIDELLRRAGRGMVLGLDRVKRSLVKLGHPEERCAFVHITGTNGKGSTSAMVSSIARAAGLRTGLFTSPHLSRWAERVSVNGEPISDEAFADALERVFAVSEEGLTFFEALTLAGFVAFDAASIEFGVLEVGIGGKQDATNVLKKPLATAITSVALDHMAILGDSIAAIAADKAGIFRPDVPVVLGPLVDEALAVVLGAANEIGAGPIYRVAREGDVLGNGIFSARLLQNRLAQIELPGCDPITTKLSLAGAHQVANAGVAAAIAMAASQQFPTLRTSIAAGLSTTTWPGRLERLVVDGKQILLDCAHNPHGALTLKAYLQDEGISAERILLVFGALGDKAWQEMLSILGPLATRRVYTSPKGRAPAPLEAMAAQFDGVIVPEGREAVRQAIRMAGEGDLVVVAGSIYLVGEIRSEILGIASDPAVAL